MQYSAYQKYLKYFTIRIDLALKIFLISRIFWHCFILALSYHFMPVFSLDVLFTFEFGFTCTIYIFTSTCYLQSIFICHYLNTFSLKFLLGSLLAFSVTSSPLCLQKCYSHDSRMCRMFLLLTTSKVAQLHYCLSLKHSH